jgi:hypothetical protein
MKKRNNFNLYIILFVLFILGLACFYNYKEGIIFSRQVNVYSIINDGSLRNDVKIKMIKLMNIKDPVFFNIINANYSNSRKVDKLKELMNTDNNIIDTSFNDTSFNNLK